MPLDQNYYHNLITCRQTGLFASISRFFLFAVSILYSIIIRTRNFLYSSHLLTTTRVNAIVISIGNITAGGTGKTPLVIWLCDKIAQNPLFKAKNRKCAILTRGYKAKNIDSDEPAILVKSCPEAKVIINPNRVLGAKKAISDFSAGVLIMDDGFQHRRLARDLDIVTIDATSPFGYNKLLPAGLLREPIQSLKRADAVVITRTDQVGSETLAEIEKTIHKINPVIPIAKSIHAPVCVKLAKDKRMELQQLRQMNVFAFCGIGNPDAFINKCQEMKIKLVGTRIFNDHYQYRESDIDEIYSESRNLKANLILATEKDWVKTVLPTQEKYDILFGYLEVRLEFVEGEGKITALVEGALKDKINL